ncbi:MAG: histidinol phosphate phosphatase [Planctomycetes bacterium]|nr:histidinol phosphate phosphatase [Planctomycetota bacterium]
MNSEWRNRYEVAQEAASAAGAFALEHFDNDVAVEWKADASPVTLADRGAEEMLRSTLLGRFPDDGFLGEEFGEQPGTSGYRWIIDPIDGTRSFVRGVPIWATLVGLQYRGECIAGVAFLPAMKQIFRAMHGDGAFRDDRRLHVSQVSTFAEAHLFYSSISWFLKAGCEQKFLQLVKQTQRQRGFGDFYGFLLVAQGSGELMVEHGVHAWDLAALKPIVEEAGGRMTDWTGGGDIFRPDVLTSNGLLHDATLALLSNSRE